MIVLFVLGLDDHTAKTSIQYLRGEDGINDLLAAPEGLLDVRDRKDHGGEIAPAFVSSMSHEIRMKVGYLSHGRSNLALN